MAEKVASVARSSGKEAEAVERRWTLKGWHKWLLIIGLIIRIAFAFSVDKESSFGGWDGKEYHAYSQSLLAGKWDDYPRFFNNTRPPFYPVFLIPFVAISGQSVRHIQFVQAVLGILLVILLAKTAGRWAGESAGDWAFVIAIFHPFLIYQSAFVLTETLFLFLLWLGMAALQRWHDYLQKNSGVWLVCAAVAFALACLTRPTLQLFLVVSVLWIGWRVWARHGWGAAFKRMALFTAVVSGLLLPWMIANFVRHHELSLAPGGFQTAYAFSNSPGYLRMYEAKTKEEYYQNFEPLVGRLSVEKGLPPETWMAEARHFRQKHPADWLKLQAYKLKHFWTPWLNPVIFSRANVLISLVTITPLFILGIAELFRRLKARDPFLLLLIGLIGVGYVVGGFLFHVQVRYRFPYVDVTFIVLSASLLAAVPFTRLVKSLLPKRLRIAEAS